MRQGNVRIWGAGVATLLALALPATAPGATRWAEPGGDGPSGSCAKADPCSLTDAAGFEAADGDVIKLLGGTYPEPTNIFLYGKTTIEPAPGAGRPFVDFTSGGLIVQNKILLRGFDVYSASGIALNLANNDAGADAMADRMRIGAAGNAVNMRRGTILRNSLVYSTGDFADAVLIERSSPNPNPNRIINSTVIAKGASTRAVYGATDSDPVELVVRNSILRGSAQDLQLFGSSPGQVTADISYSNVGPEPDAINDGPPNSVITVGPGMQTGAPLFADPVLNDFRQTPGSPTIDSGAMPGPSGPFDFLGSPRDQGAAIDIGADESTGRKQLFELKGRKRIRPALAAAGGPGAAVKRKLSVKVTCPVAACTGKAPAKLKIGKRKASVGSPKISLGQGKSKRLTYRLSSRLARKLRRAGGGKLIVRATGQDDLGFKGAKRRRYEVVP